MFRLVDESILAGIHYALMEMDWTGKVARRCKEEGGIVLLLLVVDNTQTIGGTICY